MNICIYIYIFLIIFFKLLQDKLCNGDMQGKVEDTAVRIAALSQSPLQPDFVINACKLSEVNVWSLGSHSWQEGLIARPTSRFECADFPPGSNFCVSVLLFRESIALKHTHMLASRRLLHQVANQPLMRPEFLQACRALRTRYK